MYINLSSIVLSLKIPGCSLNVEKKKKPLNFTPGRERWGINWVWNNLHHFLLQNTYKLYILSKHKVWGWYFLQSLPHPFIHDSFTKWVFRHFLRFRKKCINHLLQPKQDFKMGVLKKIFYKVENQKRNYDIIICNSIN